MIKELKTKIRDRSPNNSSTRPKFNYKAIFIDYIVCGCPVLAISEFMQRYDKAALYTHWKNSKAFSLPVMDKCYNHNPKTVVDNGQTTLICDMQVHTDKEIKANMPDGRHNQRSNK